MNQIKTSEERIKNIEELRDFLGNFSEEIDKLRAKIQEDIPPFHIPNWPKNMNDMDVRLKKRNFLFPPIIEKSAPLEKLLRLEKITADIFITIKKDGLVEIVVYKEYKTGFLKRERQRIGWFESDGKYYPIERVRCFIIFSQFLEEVCADIIRQLKEKLARLELAVAEYELTIEAVKKSFEPLIPFVVADAL